MKTLYKIKVTEFVLNSYHVLSYL